MAKLVSIITPTYNAEAFISQTITSVLKQSYTHWELIVIDDNSTDNTVALVKSFISKHENIKLLRNKTNQGAAISRNRGIEEAQGDYIAFLDADDLWKPGKLTKQLAFMKAKNCDVCFSSYELINEEGAPLNKQVVALRRLTYPKLLKSNYIGNLTGIYNVNRLGKITSPNLRKRQDWLIWLAAVKKSAKPAQGIQESLAYYRLRENSMSANKLNLIKYNYYVYKKGLGFSAIASLYLLCRFLIEHFFVKSKQTVRLDKSY